MSRMDVEGDAAERETLLLRGSLDMCVLALLDREPQHAYGVVRRLREHGFVQTGYGTVYPLVTRLRRAGLVAQRAESGRGGPARLVLSLTPAGRKALRRWTAQWHESVARVSAVLATTTDRGERHVG